MSGVKVLEEIDALMLELRRLGKSTERTINKLESAQPLVSDASRAQIVDNYRSSVRFYYDYTIMEEASDDPLNAEIKSFADALSKLASLAKPALKRKRKAPGDGSPPSGPPMEGPTVG